MLTSQLLENLIIVMLMMKNKILTIINEYKTYYYFNFIFFNFYNNF